jgi:UDP-N-acetylglucosamine--dolichyl-phosphate N-acetylglucosaminephosphotransferase
LFPRVPDQHKPNKPLVPTGLGFFYVLASAAYLFFLYYFDVGNTANGVSPSLTLAVCILFGGFLGLLDDWMDVRWRYKAFLPLIAAIPLVSFAWRLGVRTSVAIPFLGVIDFGVWYFFLIIPLLVTIITNTVNMLGGLNGLETVCPAIVMIGLAVSSPNTLALLLIGPLSIWLVLAALNFAGKLFVGNTGSFAIGMTLAAFAIISDLKFDLLISIVPYILNSVLILVTFFFSRKKASVSFDGKRLSSDHIRSLITLITYRRSFTERQVVAMISILVAASTSVTVLVKLLIP